MNGSLWMSLSVVLLSWGVVGVLQKMAVDRIGARTALVWAAAGFMLLQVVVLPTISVQNYSSKSLLCAVLNGICNGWECCASWRRCATAARLRSSNRWQHSTLCLSSCWLQPFCANG